MLYTHKNLNKIKGRLKNPRKEQIRVIHFALIIKVWRIRVLSFVFPHLAVLPHARLAARIIIQCRSLRSLHVLF